MATKNALDWTFICLKLIFAVEIGSRDTNLWREKFSNKNPALLEN